MKINAINFIKPYIPQYRGGGNSAKNIQNQQFDYSLAESIGRSQVNFEGLKNKDKEYQEYDRKFIDTLAQNLRLSDEDKQRLVDKTDKYLKDNNFKSLEAIAGDKNQELQSNFIAELGYDICKSDFDFNILAETFMNRMYYDGQYNPTVDKYEKDYEVVEHILDKYGMDDNRKTEIFDVLKMHADSSGVETVFDLFKFEKEPTVLMSLIKEQLQINDELACDLLIDFGIAANKTDADRRSEIYPWKLTSAMNEYAKDHAIACEIVGEYDLQGDDFFKFKIEEIDDDESDDNDEVEETKSTIQEIAEQLNRRREGVSIEQISYELMEKYNLPSKSYEFIKNTINEYDAIELSDDD